MKNNLFILALCLCNIVGLNVHAQDNEASLREFIRELYQTKITNIQQETTESILQHFDRKYVGSIVNVSLDGRVETEQVNYDQLQIDIKEAKKLNGDITLKWDIQNIHSAKVKGNTGAVSFDIQYSLNKKGEVISSGTNSMDVICRKKSNSWVVIFSSTISVEDVRNMGNCYCEIYGQNNGSSMLSQTLIPDGAEYIESTDKFKFITQDGIKYIKINGEETFKWESNSKDVYRQEKRVGKATTNREAVKVILREINSERCQQVTIDNK